MEWLCMMRRWWADRSGYLDGPPADEARLLPIAAEAYQQCVEWFGPPIDPHLPYVLRRDLKTIHPYCSYHPGHRRYYVVIQDRWRPNGYRDAYLAHEVYHRVTLRREGLRRERWIDEMMAYQTEYRIMRTMGFGDIAGGLQATWRKKLAARVDVEALRMFKKTVGVYPDWFVSGVHGMGAALAAFLPWEAMCRIVAAKSLEEWIANLPPFHEYPVRYLLGLSSGSVESMSTRMRIQFGYALYCVGDADRAIIELKETTRIWPYAATAHARLGFVLLQSGRPEEAIKAFYAGIDYGLADGYAYLQLARAFRQTGQSPEALTWYRKAVERLPQSALMHLNYGNALNDAGQRREARASWEAVVACDASEVYAEKARKALYRYPDGDSLRVRPRKRRVGAWATELAGVVPND